MLFVCRNCGRYEQAPAMPEDGLCASCRKKQDGEKSTANQTDWREPLYEYVKDVSRHCRCEDCDRLMAMLAMLGDYRDCPDILKKSRQRYQNAVESMKRTVESENTSLLYLENTAKDLEDLGMWFGASDLLVYAKERIRDLQEKARIEREQRMQRERRIKRLKAAAAALISGSIITTALIFSLHVLPERLERADACLAAGRFQEALTLYEDTETLWYAEEASIGVRKAKAGLADSCLAEERFEEAVRLYKEAGKADKIREAYLLWSDHLAAGGNADEALKKLSNAGKKDEYPERYAKLYMQSAIESARAVIADGAGKQVNTELARKTGLKFNTLDAQLQYCHMLADAGYDLGAVYPDGVVISDASLVQYQIEAALESDRKPDMSRVLVFERQETTYITDITTQILFGSGTSDHMNDDSFKIRLLPGEMFGQTYFAPAESWADATAVILVDGVYRIGGRNYALERLKPMSYNNISVPSLLVHKEYIWYRAISSIAAYGKEDLSAAKVYHTVCGDPVSADPVWFEANKKTPDALRQTENVHGEFQFADMYEHLEEALAAIAE